MIRYLYLALEEKLLAITDEQENPQPIFKHCDLWNRQVEFLEQETPFQTPAVFVEFTNIEWRTLGQHVQEADLTVRLHIVTPWYANTASNVQNAGVRDTALSYLDIPTVLFQQLHGQHGTVAVPVETQDQEETPAPPKVIGTFNALVRTSSTVNHNHERFVDSIETYQCHLKDLSYTVPTFKADTIGLSIDVNPQQEEGGQEQDALPNGYRRIKGLSFNGATTYQITGFKLHGSDTLRFKFMAKQACNVIGAFDGSNAQTNFSFYASLSSGSKYLRYNGGVSLSVIVADKAYDVAITPTGTIGLEIDGSWEEKSFSTVGDMFIGSTSASVTASNLVGDMIGAVTVDGRLEAIPCERESDGVLGYYDTIGGVFYEPTGDAPVSLGYE